MGVVGIMGVRGVMGLGFFDAEFWGFVIEGGDIYGFARVET